MIPQGVHLETSTAMGCRQFSEVKFLYSNKAYFHIILWTGPIPTFYDTTETDISEFVWWQIHEFKPLN